MWKETESLGLSGLGAMARNVGYGVSRVADRVSKTREANGRICMFQSEQRALGDLGSLRRRVCINRSAGLPLPYEPARVQKEPSRTTELENGNVTISRLTRHVGSSDIALTPLGYCTSKKKPRQ